jgi:hypothetical protein
MAPEYERQDSLAPVLEMCKDIDKFFVLSVWYATINQVSSPGPRTPSPGWRQVCHVRKGGCLWLVPIETVLKCSKVLTMLLVSSAIWKDRGLRQRIVQGLLKSSSR